MDNPYFDSPEYHRLVRKLKQNVGVTFDMSQCILIEVGHDGFQPFSNTSHRSTWGVWMRVKNVDPRILFRYMNVRELAMWPAAKRKRADGYKDHV